MDSRLHPSSLVWVPLNLTLDLCNNAEVQHQGWADTGNFARGSGQGLFVAWNERADGRIVRITLQAQMLADDVAHPWIVCR